MNVFLTHVFILFEVAVLLLAQPGGGIQNCCQNDLCPTDCERCDGKPTCYDLSDELGCSNDGDSKLLSYRKPPVFVPFITNVLKSGLRREKMDLYRKNPNHACFSTSSQTTTEMPLWEQLLRKLKERSGANVPATVSTTSMTSTAMPVWKLLLNKLRGPTAIAKSSMTPLSEVTTIMTTPSQTTRQDSSTMSQKVENDTTITPTTTATSLITTVVTKQTTQLDTSNIPMSDVTISVTTTPASSLDLNKTSQTSQSTDSSSITTLPTTMSDQNSVNESLLTTTNTGKSSTASVTHSATEEPVSHQSTTTLSPTTTSHKRMGIAVSISSAFTTNENNITQMNNNTTSFSLVTTTVSNDLNTTNESVSNSNSTTEHRGVYKTMSESSLLNTSRMNSTNNMSENNTDNGVLSQSTVMKTHVINESSSNNNKSAVTTLPPQKMSTTVIFDRSVESTNTSMKINLTSEIDEPLNSTQTNATYSFPTNTRTEDSNGNITYNNITNYQSNGNTNKLQLSTLTIRNETMSLEMDTVTVNISVADNNNTRMQNGNDTQNAESSSLNIANDKENSSISEYSVHEADLEVNRTENRNSYNTSSNDNTVAVSIVPNDGNVEARENVLKNKVSFETVYMSPENEIRIILEKLHALAEMEEKNMRPKLSDFNAKYENNSEKGIVVNTSHQPLSVPAPSTVKTKTNIMNQKALTETSTTTMPGRTNRSPSSKSTTAEVINVRQTDATAPPPATWPGTTLFDFNLNELLGFTSVSPLDRGFFRSSPNPLSWDAFFGDIGGVTVTHNNKYPSTGTKDHLSNINDQNVNKNQFQSTTTRALNKDNIQYEYSTKSNKIVEYRDPSILTESVKSTQVPKLATLRNHETTTKRYWTFTTNPLVTPKPSTLPPITAPEPLKPYFDPLKPPVMPQNPTIHNINPSTQSPKTSTQPPNPSTKPSNPSTRPPITSTQPPNLSTKPSNPSTQPPITSTQPHNIKTQSSNPEIQPRNPTHHDQPPIPSTELPKLSTQSTSPTIKPSKPSILPPGPSAQQPTHNNNAGSNEKIQVQPKTNEPRNDVSMVETNAILPVESISSWWQKVYSTSPPAANTSPLSPTTYIPFAAQEQCYEIQDVSGFCQTRSGHYNNPSDCRTFYVCMWGYLHRCSCPPNTMFDSKIQVCNWDNLVTCVK